MFNFCKSKWIIQDNELRMGRVVSHSDLVKEDGGKVLGGGLWHYDKEIHTLYLYNKSIVYGQCCEDDFKDIWVRPSMEDAKIYFSKYMDLEFVKKNNILIQDPNNNEQI